MARSHIWKDHHDCIFLSRPLPVVFSLTHSYVLFFTLDCEHLKSRDGVFFTIVFPVPSPVAGNMVESQQMFVKEWGHKWTWWLVWCSIQRRRIPGSGLGTGWTLIPHRIRGHRLQREDKRCFSMHFGISVRSWLDLLQTWSLLGTQLEPISQADSEGQMRPPGWVLANGVWVEVTWALSTTGSSRCPAHGPLPLSSSLGWMSTTRVTLDVTRLPWALESWV